MSSPYSEIPSGDGSVSNEDQSGEGLLYRDNLIYLPFARHLSEVDESEEREQKAA